jgi:hypothetical protein
MAGAVAACLVLGSLLSAAESADSQDWLDDVRLKPMEARFWELRHWLSGASEDMGDGTDILMKAKVLRELAVVSFQLVRLDESSDCAQQLRDLVESAVPEKADMAALWTLLLDVTEWRGLTTAKDVERIQELVLNVEMSAYDRNTIRALILVGRFRWMRGDALGLRDVEQAFDIAFQRGYSEESMLSLLVLTGSYLNSGAFSDGAHLYALVDLLGRDSVPPEVLADYEGSKGLLLYVAGERERGREAMRRAVECGREAGATVLVAGLTATMAQVLMSEGSVGEPRRCCRG